jgi:hypothetical protein
MWLVGFIEFSIKSGRMKRERDGSQQHQNSKPKRRKVFMFRLNF